MAVSGQPSQMSFWISPSPLEVQNLRSDIWRIVVVPIHSRGSPSANSQRSPLRELDD